MLKQPYMKLITCALSLFSIYLTAQTNLPLVEIGSLEYQGAFIIPPDDFGESSANYVAGTIEYNSANNSIFLAGFRKHGSIAEFAIPELVNSTEVSELNTAIVLQDFKRILNKTPDNNPQGIDVITGMKFFNNKLIVNTLEFYDAPADNTHTTVVVENPESISTSAINGYYEFEGAAHFSGWISSIPKEWQKLLGEGYLAGNSSKYPINARHSMGVSAFAFNPLSLNENPSGVIPTTTLLDFKLANPMYEDYSFYENANHNLIEVNGPTPPGHTFEEADAVVGTNNMWTEESNAIYGFIIPGSRTYMTIGSSGGHNSGIGYKATPYNQAVDPPKTCPGPCPYDSNDYYNYYWLWDVNDLIAIKNGTLNSFDARPYSFGEFDAPFQTDLFNNIPEFHPIVGGSFDSNSGLLYLTINDGAPINSQYHRNPVIAAYKISSPTLSINEVTAQSVSIAPNPANDFITISTKEENILENVVIFNALGQKIKETKTNKIELSNFNSGLYFMKIVLNNSNVIVKKFVVK